MYRSTFILAALLFVTWYILSGFDEVFFLALGVITAILTSVIAWRMAIIGHQDHPVFLRAGMGRYLLWLAKEIALSSVMVMWKIWAPDAKISPSFGWVNSSQAKDESRVMYGNSITLTPGTVCVDVKQNQILVHALCSESIDTLKDGEMDHHVTENFG